jgi:hypothetical protein
MSTVHKTLSVAELIERLKTFPPDAPVWVDHDLHYGPVLDPPVLYQARDDGIPPDAVCLYSLWLAPREYDRLVWIDHRGQRREIAPYSDD